MTTATEAAPKLSDYIAPLLEQSRLLSNELHRTEHLPCREQAHGGVSCMEKAETEAQKVFKRTGTFPGFSSYDHRKMCDACAAYWFASMTTNTLGDMERKALFVEARA